ncbi:MAG: hypothetical protein A2600_11325 [Candidatus Lambdaproteobacteria bacterium RIFOXYD1_FULL_56_27]|uniref:Co-chaperone DjlA N-terminal domain-containing protein n=1 Tax=Candidatus Lambdaproteobacteria bacterium RIFOXYD2_FULL_56_26 TaxID=1817773 RepID=A0A1F6GZG6_9PROT|nr:MAG: hypothetical protein A2426_08400 [Candidatus Lambdaproteobacteria bacterium RIFOXYC1_FULL_56_13]OGH03535.1 MAG: hypothetical protein A2557_01120 [Candidatus Lambdaproteobacteria bacterium RIFOXYD2_FULL_56_26]OGH07679.1 MAG: hypothetical protein A2600_11325 [Candidatus Lambdaproteobacteria bacterium RIFOXYD1_FULL_56_27]
MTVPINLLKPDQKYWYARLMVSAILADGEIDKAEVEFLRQVIGVVKEPGQKVALMQLIESKQAPPIEEPPTSIPDQILAAIFVELMMVCIADASFDQTEKNFLLQVAGMMRFTEAYTKSLLAWLEEGLNWKRTQAQLLPPESGLTIGQIPVDRFTDAQKYWYAELIIATILLNGKPDEFEMEMLKMIVNSVETKEEKMRLFGFVKNRLAPHLSPPPDLPQDVLLLVLLNIIQVVTADEAISYKEQTYLGQVADICEIPTPVFSRLMAWANQGIAWKNNKNGLITRVRRTG